MNYFCYGSLGNMRLIPGDNEDGEEAAAALPTSDAAKVIPRKISYKSHLAGMKFFKKR